MFLWKRRSSSIYGMNQRNRELVLRLNPPKAIQLANDKIACKLALQSQGIPVPLLIAQLRGQRQIASVYPELMKLEDGFVAKPSQGAGGRGTMLFAAALPDRVLPLHGAPWSLRDFAYFLCRILQGEYTVGKPVDAVIVEEKLNPDPEWILNDMPGVPDLRVIVYRGRAVMAMVRVPTLASGGKANLHQGGIGMGIDLKSGLSTHAVWHGRPVEHHPDSGKPLRGLPIQGLRESLAIACRCGDAVPLGYMGVDIIYDRRYGPCVVELNARPGLAIQVANQMGLDQVIQEQGTVPDVVQPKAAPADQPEPLEEAI